MKEVATTITYNSRMRKQDCLDYFQCSCSCCCCTSLTVFLELE